MPGRRLRSASSQQVAEVTKYVGCAVASAVAGCGEANLISEHRSNTIELQLHTTDLQQHYLFRPGHDLRIEHRFGAMIIEQQDDRRSQTKSNGEHSRRRNEQTGESRLKGADMRVACKGHYRQDGTQKRKKQKTNKNKINTQKTTT